MKTFKKIHFRKGWWKSLLAAILCIGVVVGAGFGIASLVKPEKVDDLLTTKTLSATKYRVGGLDKNGNYLKTDRSLYTKDAFECQGLNCVPDFDAACSYQIYFYSDDSVFMSKTASLTGTFYDFDVPVNAKFARIVITPNEDKKITVFNVLSFAKKIKVSLNRDQHFTLADSFVADSTMSGKYYNTDTAEVTDSPAYSCSTKVALGNASRVRVTFADISSVRTSGSFIVYFFNGSSIASYQVLDDLKYFTGCTENFDVPANVTHFCIAYYSACDVPGIYLL